MRYTLFSTPILSTALRGFSIAMLKIIRWKVRGELPAGLKKYVLIVAPHTSNWDFFLFVFTVSVLRFQPRVLIKSTLFVGPLGWFLRYCGAIPVNRQKASSLVTYIADVFHDNQEFVLIITPEGTRSANPNWKRGFHHIATATDVPILIVSVDSSVRCITIEQVFQPTDNVDADIKVIKSIFDTKRGLKPNNYAS
jgi:1-acyl-sn-glycerol-3-phosphate acyltransferase